MPCLHAALKSARSRLDVLEASPPSAARHPSPSLGHLLIEVLGGGTQQFTGHQETMGTPPHSKASSGSLPSSETVRQRRTAVNSRQGSDGQHGRARSCASSLLPLPTHAASLTMRRGGAAWCCAVSTLRAPHVERALPLVVFPFGQPECGGLTLTPGCRGPLRSTTLVCSVLGIGRLDEQGRRATVRRDAAAGRDPLDCARRGGGAGAHRQWDCAIATDAPECTLRSRVPGEVRRPTWHEKTLVADSVSVVVTPDTPWGPLPRAPCPSRGAVGRQVRALYPNTTRNSGAVCRAVRTAGSDPCSLR